MKTKKWLVVLVALAVALLNTGCVTYKQGGCDKQGWTGSVRPTGPADNSVHERHRIWEFEDPFTWLGGTVAFNVNVENCGGSYGNYGGNGSTYDYRYRVWVPYGRHIECHNDKLWFVPDQQQQQLQNHDAWQK